MTRSFTVPKYKQSIQTVPSILHELGKIALFFFLFLIVYPLTAREDNKGREAGGPIPTITQAGGQTDPSNASTINFTVTFDAAVNPATFTGGDISFAGSTATGTLVATPSSGDNITWNVAVTGMTGSGTVVISIAADLIAEAGPPNKVNQPSVNTDNSVTYDITPPSVNIGAPSSASTKAGPITFAITYTGASASTLVNGNVTLNTTGTATGTVGVSGVTAAGATVTISSISGDGTLGISLASGTAQDALGNLAAAAGPSTTFVVDNTGPTSTASYTKTSVKNGDGQTITVTFNQLVTGTPKITVTAPAGTVVNNQDMTIGADASIWTYNAGAVWTGNGAGTVTVGTATDALGNVVNSTPASNTFTVDNNAPTATASYTKTDVKNGDAQTITLNFNENLTVAPKITVTAPAGIVVNDQTMTVGGNNSIWTYNAGTTWTGDGSATITIGTGTDAAGNVVASPPANNTFNVDNTPPGISVGAPSLAATNTGPVTFTITYTGATGSTLVNGNVTLNTTGTATGTVGVSGVSATGATVTISSITGDGSLGITIASGTASDAAGNTAPASGASATFTVDNTGPTSTATYTKTNVKNGDAQTITLTFNQLVTGTPKITVTAPSGTVVNNQDMTIGADASIWTYNAGTTWTGNGAATVTVGTATDALGNVVNSTPASNTFTVDNNAPTSTASYTKTPLKNGDAQTITLNFNENLTVAPKITVVGPGGTIVNDQTMTVGGNNSIWTYNAGTTWTGDGNATVTIGTGTDAAGNVVTSAPASNTFVVDNTAPTSTATYTRNYIKTGTAQTVTVTFNENIVTTPRVTVTAPAGTVVNNQLMTVGGNTTIWTFAAGSTWTGNGTATVTVGTGTDAAGNVVATNPATNTFIVDNIAPSAVTVNQAGGQVDPAYGLPINYTIVFTNGPIDPATFIGSDFTVTGGTTTYTMGSISTSDNITFNAQATVTAFDAGVAGTVIPSLNLNTVSDLAGNTSGSIASTSTDATVEYIIEPTTSPTAFSVTTGPTQNTLTLTRTGGSGNRILIVGREGAAVNFVPVDGVDYASSENLNFFNGVAVDGSGNKIIDDDNNNTTFNVTGLSGGTTYHFAAFTYNRGSAAPFHNYRTTATTTSTTTTACVNPTAPTAGTPTTTPNTTGVTFAWSRTANTDFSLILLRVDDGTPNTAPVNGMDLSSIDNGNFSTAGTYGNSKVIFADESHATNLPQSKAVTNLATGVTYQYAIYTYNPTTFCYQSTHLSGTFTTTTTTDAELTVTAGAMTEPATISSLGTALSGAVGPQTNAVANFDFTVTDADGDGGATTTTDSDGANALISQIIIYQGSNNSAQLADWSQAILSAQLSDGTTSQLGTVNATNITFAAIPTGAGQLGRVDDDLSKTYTLTIALRPSLLGLLPSTIDGKQFDFNVTTNVTSSFTASGSGSTFPVGQTVSSGAAKNVVTVIATKISVNTQPSNAPIADVALTTQPIFHAQDVNNNRDLDINNALTVNTGNPSNLGPTSALASFTSGVADFTGSGFNFTTPGTSTMSVSITSPNITSANTNSITVSAVTSLVAATSITAGTDLFNNDANKSVLAFRLQTTGSNVSLNSVTFTSSLVPTTGYVYNFRLYSHSSDDFSAASLVAGPQSSLTFSGLNIPYTTTPTYFFLSVDVEGGFPSAFPTVQFSVANTGLTVSKGTIGANTVSGTNYNLVDNLNPTIQDINNVDSYLNAWSIVNNVATPAYHSDQVAFIFTFSEPVLNFNSAKISPVASSTVSSGFPAVNGNYSIASVQSVDVSGAPAGSPSRYWMVTYDILNGATGFIYNQFTNNGTGGFVQDVNGNQEVVASAFSGSPGDYFFYLTLPKPTNDPSFAASSASTSTITLNINHNHGAQRATNYYIRAKESSIGVFPGGYAVANGASALTDNNAMDNGIVSFHVLSNAYVSGAASQAIPVTGLKSGVSYDFEIYPYTLSPNVGFANSIEYKFDTPSSTTFSTTTASASMLTFVSAPTSISSLIDENPVQSASVFSFNIADDADGSNIDDAPFKFSAITINQGTGNDVPVWTDVIAGAILNDGTTDVTGVVAGTTISFTGLASTSSGNFGYIDDGANKTYTLKIWLKESLLGTYPSTIDGRNLVFSATLINADYNDGNSRLSSRLGTTNTATSGGTNVAVDVTASKLLYQTPGATPTNTE
jgi:hypothetical protein